MVTLKVSHRFGSQILFGRKRQDMRHTLLCAPGDQVLFEIPVYGPKGLEYAAHEVTCKAVHGFKYGPSGAFLDGEALSTPAAENFARAEGFIDMQELRDWYFTRHRRRTFEVFVISW